MPLGKELFSNNQLLNDGEIKPLGTRPARILTPALSLSPAAVALSKRLKDILLDFFCLSDRDKRNTYEGGRGSEEEEEEDDEEKEDDEDEDKGVCIVAEGVHNLHPGRLWLSVRVEAL